MNYSFSWFINQLILSWIESFIPSFIHAFILVGLIDFLLNSLFPWLIQFLIHEFIDSIINWLNPFTRSFRFIRCSLSSTRRFKRFFSKFLEVIKCWLQSWKFRLQFILQWRIQRWRVIAQVEFTCPDEVQVGNLWSRAEWIRIEKQ
jgi:hypothetical protein